jgi:molecular chaperone DnaK (HSP70)
MTNPVFGIDLGTTYTCIAYVDKQSGQPTVVPNAAGDLTTPSVVRFDGESRIVGKEAKQGGLIFPDETVSLVKRHIGKDRFFFPHAGRQITAEEVSSYIVKKVVKDAEQYTTLEIKDVVITCPAYFRIRERTSTQQAGEIIGLNVLAVINEPTAAAIAYGLLETEDQTVLVYDLGGGTFDVTMLTIRDGNFTVIATRGDDQLGGYDWDSQIVDYFVEQWTSETGSTNSPYDSEETMQDLYIKAEESKKSLTVLAKTDIRIVHDGQPIRVTLTREKFDELTAGLLSRTVDMTRSVIDDATASRRISSISEIKRILLVGGSSKMPQVTKALEVAFPQMELQLFKPDEAVALGAAIYGQKLQIGQAILDHVDSDQLEGIAKATGKAIDELTLDDIPEEDMQQATEAVANSIGLAIGQIEAIRDKEIINVTGHSFGIIAVDATSGQEVVSNLIRKNDRLPAEVQQQFGTLVDNQESADLQIVENEDEREKVEVFYRSTEPEKPGGVAVGELGVAVMKLPPGTPARSPINVTFKLDQHGLLSVKAVNLANGQTVDSEIQTEGSISHQEIEDIKRNVSGVSIM